MYNDVWGCAEILPPNVVEVISDLNELVFLVNELSRDFDRIFEDSERSTFTAPSSLNDRLSTVALGTV